MKSILKFVSLAIAAIAVILAAILAEGWTRKKQTETLEIAGLPIEGAKVSGFQMPDFLWGGRAWWIEIETQKTLILEFENWTGKIPAGNHRIFSNHDHTNTGEYGDRDFWGFPQSIRVRDVEDKEKNIELSRPRDD